MDNKTEEKFAESFIDAPHRVFGILLRPFCLWHLFLLRTLNSPLLAEGKLPVEASDFLTGIAVCRTRFRETKLRRPGWLRIVAYNYERERKKFLDYVSDYLQAPEYGIVPQQASGTPGPTLAPAPEELETAGDLIGWSHWSEEKVWEMPIGAAYWYRAIAIRASGQMVDFMNNDERIFQDQLKAKLMAEGNWRQN